MSTNLLTNFKINIDKKKVFLKNSNNRLFCKNFLIYLLLLKYKNNFFLKNNIHIKKYKKNVYTILRSPYRHKLARHQFFFNRYKINFSFYIALKQNIIVCDFKNIVNFLFFLKNFNPLFESNLLFINNIKIHFHIVYKNFFFYDFI